VISTFSNNLFQSGFVFSPIWGSLRAELEQYVIRKRQANYEIDQGERGTGIEHE
jgi:hypothetical protein